jgi:putative endonuclease
MHVVYVLRSDGIPPRWYIGSTQDLEARLAHHNAGGNPATRGRTWRVVYYEAYLTKAAALLRERRLKQDGRSRRYLMERIGSSLE